MAKICHHSRRRIYMSHVYSENESSTTYNFREFLSSVRLLLIEQTFNAQDVVRECYDSSPPSPASVAGQLTPVCDMLSEITYYIEL